MNYTKNRRLVILGGENKSRFPFGVRLSATTSHLSEKVGTPLNEKSLIDVCTKYAEFLNHFQTNDTPAKSEAKTFNPDVADRLRIALAKEGFEDVALSAFAEKAFLHNATVILSNDKK